MRIMMFFLSAAVFLLSMQQGIACAAGPKIYLSLYSEGGVAPVDTTTNDAWGVIKTGKEPGRMVTDGKRVYVGLEGEDSIAVIDTASDKLVGSVKDVRSTGGMDITPDRKKIVAASSGRHKVYVIDVETLRVIGNIAVDGCDSINTVKVSRDGKQAYVAGSNGIMQVIDLGLNKSIMEIKIPEEVEDEVLSADGRTLYLNSTGTGKIAVLDVGTMQVVEYIPGGGLLGLALSPDGEEIWYGGPGKTTVSVYSFKEKKVISEIQRDTDVANCLISFSPDGKNAYIGNSGVDGDCLYVIDATSKARTGVIRVKGGFSNFIYVPG